MSNLKEMRKAANMTQEKLSQESTISTSMIQKLERGLTDPSVSTIKKLAKPLALSLNLTVNIVLLDLINDVGDTI